MITMEDFGFPLASAGGGDNYEQTVGPVVTALVGFRDEVRAAAKASKPPLPEVLAMCDKLRDEGMVELGVRVEDRADGAVWKLDDPATMRKEIAEKRAAAVESAVTKVLNKLGVKAADLAKAEAAAVPPAELFKQPQFASKYGAFDEAGKPTADAKGEALSKAAVKEADKLLQKQQKEHAKHLESIGKNASFLEELKGEVGAKRAEVSELLAQERANLSEELIGKIEAALK